MTLARTIGSAIVARARQSGGTIQGTRIRPAMPELKRNLVKEVLDGQDRIPERDRRLGGTGYVHVSSLIGMCARRQVLAGLHERTVQESVTGGHRVMWALGKAAEKHARQQLIAGWGYQSVFGRWECRCGALETRGYHDSRRRCERCGESANTYEELTLFDHTHRIVGNPDLLFRDHGFFVPLECKSMTGEQFKELREPKPDHIHQAIMYRHLLEANGFPAHDEAIILYVNKNFMFGSPYKEFHVNTRSPANEALIARSLEEAARVRDGFREGVPPPRLMCDSVHHPEAKKCPLVGLCFNSSQ